ncbi:leucine-rich repeat domain-containing protein [Microcoleus sp. S28C3]|uniref:leucine-rich repeat domain-containing protein n=1 Tax=Microcoleus sp. S28C3 TaxID=3055414 RepID=UPI002FD74B4B
MILLIPVFMLVVWSQPENTGNEPSSWVVQEQRGDSRRTFAGWCREKASLSPETEHTVKVLLKKAGTTECEAADRQLSSLTQLTLDYNHIKDIEPLTSLTNLTELSLDWNYIEDIEPLTSLTNLTGLSLDWNPSRDLKPLASLTNLTTLSLEGYHTGNIEPLASLTNLTRLNLRTNQIKDLKPLASLTKLNQLVLGGNQISDIKPLASLTHLTELYLENNQISDIKPLTSLTNLVLLSLYNNQISDIKPLASLTNLVVLSLYNNQISDIKPLASLTNLAALDFDNNQIGDIKQPALTSFITLTRLASGGELDHIAERLAVRTRSHPLAGWWEEDDCSDDFGLAITSAGEGLYSISFCDPDRCFVPGTYRPNSRIVGDRSYRVVNNDTIDVEGRDGFTRFIRCPLRPR